MRILYDHQIFDMQHIGGISRYFYELIAHYSKDEGVNWDLPIIYSNNEYLKNIPGIQGSLLPKSEKKNYYQEFLGGAQFRGKGFLYGLKKKLLPEPPLPNESEKNKAHTIEKIKAGNFDLFHPTYYDSYFLDYLGNKPFVLTVYDLIHQVFPEFGMFETRDKNELMLNQANKIIAISESTKKDLINIFNLDEHKIQVTYLANSFSPAPAIVSSAFKEKLPEKFLLFVGYREIYKNFLFFAQIFAALAKEQPDLMVVCTGTPFSSAELFLFNKLGITDRVFQFFVNDSELTYLYQQAIAFVFPSMYEGFGLPVLEAFSCGCPVLLSNSSSLPEVGGEAVVYFEPKNPESMMKAIRRILNDKELRKEKIAQGYDQLKKFSWQKTADETKRIYEQVLIK